MNKKASTVKSVEAISRLDIPGEPHRLSSIFIIPLRNFIPGDESPEAIGFPTPLIGDHDEVIMGPANEILTQEVLVFLIGINHKAANARKAMIAPKAKGAAGDTRFHKIPASKLAGKAMTPTDAL